MWRCRTRMKRIWHSGQDFHQAEMDVTSLLPGEDFSKLRTGYVIFICTFDPFGKGLYRYTFENRCFGR